MGMTKQGWITRRKNGNAAAWNRGKSNWMSEEQKEAIKQANTGHIPWNKGRHIRINDALVKYRESGGQVWNKGLHPEYMQGENHHYYGKRFSDEHRRRLSEAHKGVQAKDKNPAWRGGVTSQNRLDRVKFSETLGKEVMERDNYTCQICDQYGGNLHADHIKGWSEYPELRFNPDNCRTLCVACHYYITFKRKMPSGSVWGQVKRAIT